MNLTHRPSSFIPQAQPLLTCRQQTRSQSQHASTTLVCLNCNMAAYTVDVSSQRQQSQGKTTVGFDHSSGPLPAKSTRNTSETSATVDKVEEQEVLRPDPLTGTLWILSGCLQGSEVIAKRAASEVYSSTFDLLIEPARGERDVGEEDASVAEAAGASSARRAKSPSARPLHSRDKDGSWSPSPSPARNKTRAWVNRTEEEEGDDLDTLHLLENLLPPMPSSLFQESTSPTQAGSIRSPRKASTSHTSSYFPLQNPPPMSQKRLELQLETSAMTALKAHREAAQREIHQLLKAKRKELGQLEQRMRRDARQLVGTRSRSSSKEEASRVAAGLERERQEEAQESDNRMEKELRKSTESGSPLFERRRPVVGPSSSEMARANSQGTQSDSGPPVSSTLGSVPKSSSWGASAMLSGSYLSASFAMRGREPPQVPTAPAKESGDLQSREDEEEWYAQKRRLRERYPHADHSALPSAVNSDDEGNVEVKRDENSDEEEERRGRVRGRNRVAAPVSASEATKRTDFSQDSPADPQLDGTGSEEGIRKQAPGSFGAKKGALKGIIPATGKGNGVKATPLGEKKVVFAETPGKSKELSRQPSQEPPREPVDEGSDAVFEIDEDLDGDETPGSSDFSLDSRTMSLDREGKSLLSVAEEELLTAEEDLGSVGDEDKGPGDGVAQSLPTVGSFSAMASSEDRQRKSSTLHTPSDRIDEDEFDPASLSLDDRPKYSPQQAHLSLSGIHAAAAEDIEGLHDTRFYGSRPRPSRRLSLNTPDASLAGFPQDTEARASTIGFRVAVGEAEARLSGLLAPHAPSHRGLWSSSEKRRLKANGKEAAKYNLKGDDNEVEGGSEGEQGQEARWAAWQTRISKANASTTNEADAFARSVPIGIVGMHILQDRQMKPSTTTFHDNTSGFDLEPKTSLPYQEKKLTPSLRQATRHLAVPTSLQSHHRSSLATIPDATESTGSTSGPTEASRQGSVGRSSGAASTHKPVESFSYAIPSSITRGFAAPSLALETQSMPTSTQSTPVLGSVSKLHKRSPARRTVYVPPPPPSTYDLRLEPSEKNRPAEIALEEFETDKDLASREEREGEEDLERDLQFMHTIELLKTNKRTGWLHHRVARPESIADHMYRMAVLSMLLPSKGLDIGKCVQLCLVHDIAEALVGDLTPLDGVDKAEKLRREKEALLHLVHDLLGSSPAALRLEQLWMEYEERQTAESKVVKDLDRFELGLQAVEYERRFNITDLQPFFMGSLGLIRHVSAGNHGDTFVRSAYSSPVQPRIRRWARQLAKEREQLWAQTPYKYHQTIPSDA